MFADYNWYFCTPTSLFKLKRNDEFSRSYIVPRLSASVWEISSPVYSPRYSSLPTAFWRLWKDIHACQQYSQVKWKNNEGRSNFFTLRNAPQPLTSDLPSKIWKKKSWLIQCHQKNILFEREPGRSNRKWILYFSIQRGNFIGRHVFYWPALSPSRT
jgi:hypothetical protein